MSKFWESKEKRLAKEITPNNIIAYCSNPERAQKLLDKIYRWDKIRRVIKSFFIRLIRIITRRSEKNSDQNINAMPLFKKLGPEQLREKLLTVNLKIWKLNLNPESTEYLHKSLGGEFLRNLIAKGKSGYLVRYVAWANSRGQARNLLELLGADWLRDNLHDRALFRICDKRLSNEDILFLFELLGKEWIAANLRKNWVFKACKLLLRCGSVKFCEILGKDTCFENLSSRNLHEIIWRIVKKKTPAPSTKYILSYSKGLPFWRRVKLRFKLEPYLEERILYEGKSEYYKFLMTSLELELFQKVLSGEDAVHIFAGTSQYFLEVFSWRINPNTPGLFNMSTPLIFSKKDFRRCVNRCPTFSMSTPTYLKDFLLNRLEADFFVQKMSGDNIVNIFIKLNTEQKKRFFDLLGADCLRQKLSGANIVKIDSGLGQELKKFFFETLGQAWLRETLSGDDISELIPRQNHSLAIFFLKLLGHEYLEKKLSRFNIIKVIGSASQLTVPFLELLGRDFLSKHLSGDNVLLILKCRPGVEDYSQRQKRLEEIFGFLDFLGADYLESVLSENNLVEIYTTRLFSKYSFWSSFDDPASLLETLNRLLSSCLQKKLSLAGLIDISEVLPDANVTRYFLKTLKVGWFKEQFDSQSDTKLSIFCDFLSFLSIAEQRSLIEEIDLKKLLTADQYKKLQYKLSLSDLPPERHLYEFWYTAWIEGKSKFHPHDRLSVSRYDFLKEKFPELPTYRNDLNSYPLIGFSQNVFTELYPLTKQACENEKNNGAECNALKLSVLFTTAHEAKDYLKQYKEKYPDSTQPVHDACLFDIPKQSGSDNFPSWDIVFWRQFAKQCGYDFKKMSLLVGAAELEKYLNGPLTPPYLVEVKLGKKLTEETLKIYYREELEGMRGDKPRPEDKETGLWQICLDALPNDVSAYAKKFEKDRRAHKNAIIQLRATSLQSKTEHDLSRKLRELYSSLLPTELESYVVAAEKHDTASELEKYNTKLKSKAESRESKKQIREQILPTLLRQLFSEETFELIPDQAPVTGILLQTEFEKFLNFVVRRRMLGSHDYKALIALSSENVIGEVEEAYQEEALKLSQAGLGKKSILLAINHHKRSAGQQNYIPDLKISGELIGHPQYYIEKIPRHDLSIFNAGNETNSCQNLDGNSRDCVVHSATSPYGGVYRIMRKTSRGDKWVAQSWVALTEDNELLADSIERNQGYDTQMIMDFYHLAATDILRRFPTIRRVIFGAGGQTPKTHSFPLLATKNANRTQQSGYSRIIGYWNVGYDSWDERFVLAEQGKLDPILVQKLEEREQPPLEVIPRREISEDGFTLAAGVYVKDEYRAETMALEPFRRNLFFKSHPRVNTMLRKFDQNPPIEEGYTHLFHEGNQPRQRFGELVFNFEALKLLLNKKIVEQAESDQRYKVDNFIFTDNKKDLIDRLKNHLELIEEENILIGYYDGIHYVSAYIQKIASQIKCFVSCPGGLCDSALSQAIQAVYPPSKIIRMTANLHPGFDSAIFLIKALMFYAKHGKTLFFDIDRPENLKQDGIFYNLAPGKTPALLLKMARCGVVSSVTGLNKKYHIQVDPEVLQKTVSTKTGLTLAKYLSLNVRALDGKQYSAATIAKKYKYFHALETLLEKDSSHVCSI